jgi:internalin A
MLAPIQKEAGSTGGPCGKESPMDEKELLRIIEKIEIGGITNLFLQGHEIKMIPREIGKLTHLETLIIDRNQLTELPQELEHLTKLKTLSIGENPLKIFPREIAQLTSLRKLFVDESQLDRFAENLFALKHLELYVYNGSQYEQIPDEFLVRLKNAQELQDYYFLIRKGKGKELNEAKILVLGQGSVGKTSLIRRLITGQYSDEENKTDGIEIYKDWKVDLNGREVQLNVWDFGGQEIMHATHQFFLTKRSLYVLVLDSRLDRDENRIDYWLEKIKNFGGDSPVIIVGNKIDQHHLDINQTGLRKTYPNIKQFTQVSCKTEENIDAARYMLLREVSQLDGLHVVLPSSWFEIKEELENMGENYIPYRRYLGICESKRVEDEGHQRRLIALLHDLGIVLNFSDDIRLRDTNVLNPEWVTQGVYKILNSIELFKAKGVLTQEMLGQILDKHSYPIAKQPFIVDMMRKFEICFDIKADQEVLVPDLLSEDEINTGNWQGALRFEYQYNVLFNSILTRFIVKTHKSISKNTYWRTGVVLEYKVDNVQKNEALVTADAAKRKITIAIRGSEHTRRDFLSRIREKFEEIYYSYPKEFRENVAEKVPIPRNPEIVVDYKHLLTLEELGEKYIIPEGLSDRFSVKDLLNGVESEQQRIKLKAEISTYTSPSRVNSESRTEELTNLERQIAVLDITKSICDRDGERLGSLIAKTFVCLTMLVHLVSFVVLIYLILLSGDGWTYYEKWTFAIFVGLEVVNLLFSSIFFIKTSKEFSWSAFRESLIENRRNRKYLANTLNVEDLEKLRKELRQQRVSE